MKGIKIVFTTEEFAAKGFDGEIAKYMREHTNTAIVGSKLGETRHVVRYSTLTALRAYESMIEKQ